MLFDYLYFAGRLLKMINTEIKTSILAVPAETNFKTSEIDLASLGITVSEPGNPIPGRKLVSVPGGWGETFNPDPGFSDFKGPNGNFLVFDVKSEPPSLYLVNHRNG